MLDARRALQEIFGFDDFRPGQEAAVAGALEGRDVLVVMPTGAGKSLCYQLPALLREDLTIVVSPLVSLMQDQVEGLQRRVGDAVALVNAQQDAEANRAVLDRARAGTLRLLYVAPERFSSPGFLEALREVPIGLFVVDEAHCVSQWGHDFRPDYFRLADAARWLGAQAVVASTATATPQVAADIERRLGLREPVRVATGFDRPEPDVRRRALPRAGRRRGAPVRRARRSGGAPGHRLRRDPRAVRAGRHRSRRRARDRGRRLPRRPPPRAARDRAAPLHGRARWTSSSPPTRSAWASTRRTCGRSRTSAFRPRSRPGTRRPGAPGATGVPRARCCSPRARDKGLHVFFIERAELSGEEIDRVAERLLASATDGRIDVDARGLGAEPDQVRAIVGHLVRAGVLRPAPAPVDRVRGRIEASYDGRARATCRTSAADGTRARWRQYRSIWSFVEDGGCRRAAILRHFGDPATPAPVVPCCDVCDPESVADVTSIVVSRGGGTRPRGNAANIPAADLGDLDAAILDVVERAQPSVGRTRAVEILRGGRSKVVAQHGYDGLPAYGAFAGARADDVLARVDELLAEGRLVSTGGRFPKLAAAA